MRVTSKTLGTLPLDVRRAVRAYESLYEMTFGTAEFTDEWDRKYTITKHPKPSELQPQQRLVPDDAC